MDRFTPTQIVEAAILTCTSTSANATTTECDGAKLNGMDIHIGFPEADAICNAVTGAGLSFASGGPAVAPYFIWNGSSWALASALSARIDHIVCNLS